MQHLIILICLSFLFAHSVQAGSLSLAVTEPPFRQVKIVHGVTTSGQEQTLSVALDQIEGEVATLRLVINYPGGASHEIFSETRSNTMNISWIVPADAGVGAAQVKLTTSGCGCGLRTRPASPVNTESSAEGTFFIIGS